MPLTRRRPEPVKPDLPSAPPATRVTRPGWRDPRLAVGLLIVAGSVLAGARVLAAADDTVPVWAVRRPVPVGATLTPDDLTRRRVRLEGDGLAAYVGPGQPSPVGRVLVRELAPGELLPRTALRTGTPAAEVEVPLSVAREYVPEGVRPGAVVDVWAVPPPESAGGDGDPTAVLALGRVRVVDAPRGGDALAPQATRSVVVAVEAGRDLAGVLAATAAGRIVLTLRPSA